MVEVPGIEPGSEINLVLSHSQAWTIFSKLTKYLNVSTPPYRESGSHLITQGNHFGLVCFGGTNHLSDIG